VHARNEEAVQYACQNGHLVVVHLPQQPSCCASHRVHATQPAQ
jgi:hypothetical protein